MIYELFLQPFADYGFMRRALVACLALALSGAPLGVFMVQRRMALMGDAMSHAVLPGAALAYWAFGLSVLPMAAGGLMAGLLVAALAGALSRLTQQSEDASFSGLFTLSLAVGVLLVSLRGSPVDMLHLLFGNVLGVDNTALLLIMTTCSLSLLTLSAIYRPLVLEGADPLFFKTAGGRAAATHQAFLVLLVLNLVAAFHALGTLMAVGMLVLPALSVRFWSRSIDHMIALSMAFSSLCAYAGLLASYHFQLPCGPAIVLCGGLLYAASMTAGAHGSMSARYLPRRHLAH